MQPKSLKFQVHLPFGLLAGVLMLGAMVSGCGTSAADLRENPNKYDMNTIQIDRLRQQQAQEEQQELELMRIRRQREYNRKFQEHQNRVDSSDEEDSAP